MPTQTMDEVRNPAPRKQPYTLYAANGRVYARNAAGPVIDLGALRREQGAYCYLLDGNKLSGGGFSTEKEALREIAARLHFLWLDGQFTALPDVRQTAGVDFSSATHLDIELDELGPNERIEDARV
ncbi:hypothetical protein [Ramlibacter albus]|uniref:Uncharacterized protein n=1 Tax=Ramlibacter albus TaxID=2079448 RepID=A0A923MAG5_9BURK|nr:hypothetical protein [Ramlibacter albus]MBC5766833.1 hypothetical protein [Ramlibacter albus]